LAQIPDSYGIYNMLAWKFQPQWGGSLGAVATIAADAQAHIKSNPLLGLLQAKASAYRVNLNDCNCHTPDQLAQYRSVFDQVSTSKLLAEAGAAAESSNQPGMAVVYLSEALRFQPELEIERLRRAMLLNNFDESTWAVQEATELLKSKPNDVVRLRLRATSYESLNDYAHAERDAQAILAQEPADSYALMTLSNIYMDDTQQWDKAWEVVSQMIKYYPNEPQAWFLRARIQRSQPRAGLKDTVDYYAEHFGNDPEQLKAITWLRAELALQQGEQRAAAAKANTQH
jgi:tetratricopeptide (TPR) repeat protein